MSIKVLSRRCACSWQSNMLLMTVSASYLHRSTWIQTAIPFIAWLDYSSYVNFLFYWFIHASFNNLRFFRYVYISYNIFVAFNLFIVRMISSNRFQILYMVNLIISICLNNIIEKKNKSMILYPTKTKYLKPIKRRN